MKQNAWSKSICYQANTLLMKQSAWSGPYINNEINAQSKLMSYQDPVLI